MKPEHEIVLGIDGETGQYLPPALSEDHIRQQKEDYVQDPKTLRELEWWSEHYGEDDPLRWTVPGVDLRDLGSSGWGVIFGPDVDDDIKEALEPLLNRRKKQAGSHYFEETYTTGLTKEGFYRAHKLGFGPANPKKVPYYLLLVGDPKGFPFEFQYELDVAYGVGRLHLDDAEDYESYAQSVVAAEEGKVARPQEVAFFGPRHDIATEATVEHLIQPLAKEVLAGRSSDWSTRLLLGDEATKARLGRLLGGEATPALLFAACHGLRYRLNHPWQLTRQGALVCQEWTGPVQGPVSQDHYFSAADVGTADLSGLIAFFFTCYGAGNAQYDNFSHGTMRRPAEIAPYSFVSALGKRLLSRGALAVLGHVERAWLTSIASFDDGTTQTEAFASTLKMLFEAYPVGFAMEYLNQRYAEAAVALSSVLEKREVQQRVSRKRLIHLWKVTNDARNYVVLGDPAVRLLGASPSGP